LGSISTPNAEKYCLLNSAEVSACQIFSGVDAM